MRLKVILSSRESPLTLPINYQHLLQGVIYQHIGDPDFATFLHEKGFQEGPQSFKLFTFSRLYGRHQLNREKGTIQFNGPVEWQISSVVPQFIQGVGQSLLMASSIRIGEQEVAIEELHYFTPTVSGPVCRIVMRSPLTVHHTVQLGGKRKTHFFHPQDEVFPLLIEQNLKKKYRAYHGKEAEGELSIRPLRVTERDKVVTRFKQIYITAYMGEYELAGSPELINFALGAGIGARNSAGFGLFDLAESGDWPASGKNQQGNV